MLKSMIMSIYMTLNMWGHQALETAKSIVNKAKITIVDGYKDTEQMVSDFNNLFLKGK
jgi:hypothetical protein